MAILVVVPNSMFALAILWLDLSYAVGSVRAQDASILLEAQSGLMNGDYSVIDYSMQCGSLDVGVSMPAACLSAASSVVLAPVVAAFPFPSCGLALCAELRLFLVFWFQSLNFDGVICYLSLEMVSHWTFLREPWTLECNSWIQSGVLSLLMANRGGCASGARVCCSRCDGFLEKPVCYAVALVLEEIGGQEVLQAAAARAAVDSDHDAHTFLATSEARAFGWLHCVMAPQAAAARAAAYFQLVALSCLVTSVAQAFEYVSRLLSWHAAAASAAGVVRGEFLRAYSGAHIRFLLDLLWSYFAGSLEFH